MFGTRFATESGVKVFTNLTRTGDIAMMPSTEKMTRGAKIRYGLAALLLGLPLPFVIIAFLMPGCGGNR